MKHMNIGNFNASGTIESYWIKMVLDAKISTLYLIGNTIINR